MHDLLYLLIHDFGYKKQISTRRGDEEDSNVYIELVNSENGRLSRGGPRKILGQNRENGTRQSESSLSSEVTGHSPDVTASMSFLRFLVVPATTSPVVPSFPLHSRCGFLKRTCNSAPAIFTLSAHIYHLVMAPKQFRRIVLAERPKKDIIPDVTFKQLDIPFDSAMQPGPRQALVHVHYVSLGPYSSYIYWMH